jgi:hypothetical protein
MRASPCWISQGHLGTSLIYNCSVVTVRGGPIMTADDVGLLTEPIGKLDGHTI